MDRYWTKTQLLNYLATEIRQAKKELEKVKNKNSYAGGYHIADCDRLAELQTVVREQMVSSPKQGDKS